MNPPDPKEVPGSQKCPLHLVPPAGTQEAAWVHKGGNDKYGPFSWRGADPKASTYVGALKRHIDEYFWEGIDADHESGRHPLGHVIAGCNIILDAIRLGVLVDDRPGKLIRKKGPRVEACGLRKFYHFGDMPEAPEDCIHGVELSPVRYSKDGRQVVTVQSGSEIEAWAVYRIDNSGYSWHVRDYATEEAALVEIALMFGDAVASAMKNAGGIDAAV